MLSSFWAGAQDFCRLNLWTLAARAGGFEQLEADPEPLLRGAGVDEARLRQWLAAAPRQTLGEAITLADPRYPRRLLRLAVPPPVLMVEGEVAALRGRSAWAVVGTRSCTSYGRGVTQHLAGRLAARGVTVVSGLARGVDGAAHAAAARVGVTVAVLGHGLGTTSPTSHRALRGEILRNGGAVVSTWHDGYPAGRHTFLQRNGVIVGLADGVVVTEAPRRSGALNTARLAADLGIEVAAVPGPLGAANSEGCLRLIAEGAGVVVGVDDFVESVGELRPTVPRPEWLDLLFSGATLEQVAKARGVSLRAVLTEVSRMELAGELVRLPGQRYAPARELL